MSGRSHAKPDYADIADGNGFIEFLYFKIAAQTDTRSSSGKIKISAYIRAIRGSNL